MTIDSFVVVATLLSVIAAVASALSAFLAYKANQKADLVLRSKSGPIPVDENAEEEPVVAIPLNEDEADA